RGRPRSQVGASRPSGTGPSLENLALRQQLAAYHERRDAASGRATDFFWMALARIWRNWRTALVFVQPDTVVRWHRDWLRRRWARRSKRRHEGRPPVDPQIRIARSRDGHGESLMGSTADSW